MDRRVVKLQNSLKLMMLGARQERIEIARAELAQAEAELTKAKWRLDNCTIRAPVTGSARPTRRFSITTRSSVRW